jgi:TolC family type I secretion outer membrane protein
MTRTLITLLALAVVLTGMGARANGGGLDTLTVERAVQLALDHHPSLRSAEANVRGAVAGHKGAIAGYLPAITFSASATHNEGVFVFNPSVPSRNQIYSNYTGGFQAQQTLFDFGKTINRVSASTDLADAAASDFVSARELVRVNVQIAYYGLLAARGVAAVNDEAVSQAEKHLLQAKAFYSVGTRPRFDVTKAEVDLANAKVNQIIAANQMQVAQVQLENAMGFHPDKLYTVSESLPSPLIAVTMDSARALALLHRPELQAAHLRAEAARSQAHAAWDQHLPTLSAVGTWNWNGFDPSPLYPRWTAGIQLTFPIFQGFSLDAQVEQANAAADAAQAAFDTQAQSVLLEVEQAYLGLKEAEERKVATAKLVEQADENFNLAQRQYAAGVGTAIEVADAQLSRSNAQITNIQAQYDYITSLVRLRRALGTAAD